MSFRKLLPALLLIIVTLLNACTPQPTPTTSPTTEVPVVNTQVPVVNTQAPATVQGPTEVSIITVHISTVDNGWDKSFIDSIKRVIAQAPHGLVINHEVVESVAYADAERVMNDLASTGKYDIIFEAGGLRDATCASAYANPNQLYAITTNGEGYDCYKPGANLILYNSSNIGECGYLMGALAGWMTKSNTLGIVAGFPSADINEPINAFFDGAKAANASAKTKVTFIQSWYDPQLARDAADAQINAGADFVWGTIDGIFAATEARKVFAGGIYVDQNYLSPTTVVASVTANWDPYFEDIINKWWDFKVNGTPISAPAVGIKFGLAQNSCDIIMTPGLVPTDISKKVTDLKQQIVDGTLQVNISGAEPVAP